MKRLDGKVVIVLGAAGEQNMGQAIARRFAAEGAKVVVAGRNETVLQKLSAEIGGSYALCDITNKSSVDALTSQAYETHGRLDIGINATGWGLMKDFLETSEQDLDRMHDVQFKGPILFFQSLIREMSNGGSIIQISSATAKIMLEHHSAYMGTKAGIDHVIRTIANEFGHKGIRANSISPGLTKTPMSGSSCDNSSFLSVFEREYPLGRIGTVEDIAAAAVWLASDECFMTGENLQVNGGLTLRRNPSLAEMGDALSELSHLST